jgi:hypothetical protein
LRPRIGGGPRFQRENANASVRGVLGATGGISPHGGRVRDDLKVLDVEFSEAIESGIVPATRSVLTKGRSHDLQQQERQSRLAAVFHLERQQIVGARPTEVDGGDRDAAARGSLGEAEAGIDHKGRTHDEHGIGALQVLLGQGDLIARDVLARRPA